MLKKLLLALFIPVVAFSAPAQKVEDFMASGQKKMDMGDNPGAIKDFAEAIKLNQTETDSYLKKRKEYNGLSDYEKALVESGEVLTVKHELAVPYYSRGMAYAATSTKDLAQKDFETAVDIDPKYADALLQRGVMRHEAGKKEEGCMDIRAAADYGSEKAKEIYEDKFCWNSSLNYAKDGMSHLKLNQYDKALTDFDLALRINPDSAQNYVYRGRCYYGLGKFNEAQKDFDMAIKKRPYNPEAYYYRGLIYYVSEKWNEAITDFGYAIGADKKFADGYLYRGMCYENIGNTKGALTDYTMVQKLRPEDGLAFFKSAMVKKGLKQKMAACVDFKISAELGYDEAVDYAAECQ